jgi:hypothetical protein
MEGDGERLSLGKNVGGAEERSEILFFGEVACYSVVGHEHPTALTGDMETENRE